MRKFHHSVKFHLSPRNQNGWEVITWLNEEYNLRAGRDYQIDMHGGVLEYVTLDFKDQNMALMTKLAWI